MQTISSYTGEEQTGTPRVGWLVGLIVATTVVMFVALITVYLGVNYGDPSWAAHSYPPPILP
jgi:hypothetical protein